MVLSASAIIHNFKSFPTPMNTKTTLILVFVLLTQGAIAQDISLEGTLPDSLQGPARVKALNQRFGAYLPTDPVTAVGYARQAYILATEISDTRGLAAACNNLGVAYRNQGALDKALEYYIASLRLYDSIANPEGTASTRNNIANIYALKKDYDQAMRYFEESHAVFEKLGDSVRLMGSMNNLGNLYGDIKMPEKALQYYEAALSLAEKTGAKRSDPLVNIGNLYFGIGNHQIAIDYYEKALAIEKRENDKLAMIDILTNMGITYSQAGQPSPAGRYLNEALGLAEELHAFTAQPPILKAIAETYATQKHWQQAYEMLRKYDALRENIYSEESSRKIAQMEMVLDFQEKERELEILQREDRIKTVELRNTRLIIVLVVMAILIVIGAASMAYGRRQRFTRQPV